MQLSMQWSGSNRVVWICDFLSNLGFSELSKSLERSCGSVTLTRTMIWPGSKIDDDHHLSFSFHRLESKLPRLC